MTRRSRTALLAAVLLVGLALSGCAASDSDGTTSKTTRPVPTRATTTAATTSYITLPPETVTHTVSPPPPTTTSTPPAPPPPPEDGGGGGGGGGNTDDFPLVNQTRIVTRGDNSATVAWNVSDDSAVVNSRVEYGIGDGNFTLASPDRAGQGNKQEILLGLAACTEYGYRVSARDSANHVSVGLNPVPRFTTTGTIPTVTNLTFPSVLHTSITISWRVNGPSDTVTQVEYGTNTGYGSLSPTYTGAGVKSATISSLVPNMDYHFRIRITSPCGSSNTGDIVQRTATLVHVDIKGSLGATGSFDKGSTVYGPLMLVAGRPYVFEVQNDDTTAHTFNIVCLTENSTSIPGGQTYTFSKSFVFSAANTPCNMGCSFHAGMDGIIDT